MPSWPTITDGATVLANALFTSIKAYIDGLTTLVFSNTGLKIRDTNDTHDLTIAAGSDLTANRTLTLTTGDANRTLTISGASTIDQNVSTTGSPTHAALTVTGASTLATITGTTLDLTGVATVDALALSTALAAASGGTGLTAVGTSGNVLTSNGSEWVSKAPSVTSSGAIAASVASNILTLSLTTTDGSTPSAGSPVTLTFRHVTPATGSLSTVSVTAATTVAIPNTATLGTSNSVAFRVWVVAFNDGGTVRLGAINCANSTSIYPLAGWGIASSTAVSTGSDSAQVFYTGTSVSAKAYTVLGYVSYDAGLATAGTWSSAPTQAQPLRPDTRLPGSTVQVVYATYATEVSSTSATYADTGLTATITPTSTPNRMLISAVQTGLRKNNNTYGRLRLQRGATTLADLELQYGFTNTTVENTVGASAIHYVDLPASVAATTYKTTFASATGAATVSLQMSGSMSTIVVQELMV